MLSFFCFLSLFSSGWDTHSIWHRRLANSAALGGRGGVDYLRGRGLSIVLSIGRIDSWAGSGRGSCQVYGPTNVAAETARPRRVSDAEGR